MSPKRSAPVKRSRVPVTLDVKMDILKRHRSGEGTTKIGRALGLPASTVHSIVKSAPIIEEMAGTSASVSGTKVTRFRNSVMEKMERLLRVWIENQTQRSMPISQAIIQEKARSLWRDVRKEVVGEGENSGSETFSASRGWFDRFRKRASLHNIKMTGEAASADEKAAEEYPAILKKTIEDEGYAAKQVFMSNPSSCSVFFHPREGNKSIEQELVDPEGRTVEGHGHNQSDDTTICKVENLEDEFLDEIKNQVSQINTQMTPQVSQMSDSTTSAEVPSSSKEDDFLSPSRIPSYKRFRFIGVQPSTASLISSTLSEPSFPNVGYNTSSSSASSEVIKEDEHDIFGRHVANELRSLPDDVNRRWARFQIQKVLFEAHSCQKTS